MTEHQHTWEIDAKSGIELCTDPACRKVNRQQGRNALSASPVGEGALQPSASVPTEQAGGPVVGDPLSDAREAFLNMVADAKKWEFETDGDETGCWATVTMVSDHSQVEELCDALGMVGPYDEFIADRIERYVQMPPAPSTTSTAEQVGAKPIGEQIVCGNDWQRRMLDPTPGEGEAPVAWSGREHDLKTWRKPFAAVRALLKPWELRFDDRGYQTGDILNLREWDEDSDADDQYTGEVERRIVTWLLRGPAFGLPEGYVIMSMVPLSRPTPATPEGLREKVADLCGFARAREDHELIAKADAILAALQPQAQGGQ